MKKDVHVVPHKDGWVVKVNGHTKATAVVPTQTKARDIAK